ncbi:hypothetical protein PpBr36_01435 [Pyricularia pennisetigena]|uniref:hypothetical protein n=1 Tax=Pyricularia pennisetigena TaxID=1578925 RepID=UPI001154CB01|nr:hypothetical protein PpBr36_01435 [Pyricularia pennisetigena]TLS29552.1 hypothetical protein PpBr36_01435 [Pyricularia pennisetigena]
MFVCIADAGLHAVSNPITYMILEAPSNMDGAIRPTSSQPSWHRMAPNRPKYVDSQLHSATLIWLRH